ncbi:hypothetical protein NE237_030012 [Protea cynaroides]|uniref:Uncharacterized protein n=1 Tax=Protea cynaroides TaxID=273540 RepID=A0A9Q0JWL2_9MAGN|nr:hypothetical protein NE237_030012 [Protea cynaroides]
MTSSAKQVVESDRDRWEERSFTRFLDNCWGKLLDKRDDSLDTNFMLGQMFRTRFVSAFFLFVSLLFSSQFLNTFALHGITKPKNGDSAALVHLGRQPFEVSLAAVPEKDPMNAGRLIDVQKLVIHQKIVRIPRGIGIGRGKTTKGTGYVGGHTSTSDASVALISSLHYLWFIVTSLVYLNFF